MIWDIHMIECTKYLSHHQPTEASCCNSCYLGVSYFYSRLKQGIGLYLGLTGARLNAADVLELGIATHYIGKEKLDQLLGHCLAVDVSRHGTGSATNDDGHVSYLKQSELDNLLE